MRQPKPFFRTFNKSWYVTLAGRQINLGRDEEQAYAKYFDLMANRGQAVASFSKVAQVFDAYLAWVREHRSQGTYDKGVHYLSHLTKIVGTSCTIAVFSPTNSFFGPNRQIGPTRQSTMPSASCSEHSAGRSSEAISPIRRFPLLTENRLVSSERSRIVREAPQLVWYASHN